jgi:hypothetical protein
MARASSWAISLPALLFSVAVVGALIGLAWEHAVYSGASSSDEWEPPGLGEGSPARPLTRPPAEEAVLARVLSHFPPYPRAGRAEVLAADYLGPDVPMAVAWFSTRDTPEQVLGHYERTLLDAGLPVLGHRLGSKGGYVGYWSPATEETRLVNVMGQSDQTLVFVSAGRMGKLLERAMPVPAWVPLPPGLTAPVALAFVMEGATHHVVSGQLAAATLAQVEARYREVLQAQGWSVGSAEPVAQRGLAFEVARDGVSGRAVLRHRSQAEGVEVHLSLRQGGAP